MYRSPLPRSLCTVCALGCGAVVSTSTFAAAFVERVSAGIDGVELSRSSGAAAISSNGRFTAFVTSAAGVAPGSSGGKTQVYVRERRDVYVKTLASGEIVAFATGGASPATSSTIRCSAGTTRSIRWRT